jgi:hypothetical protein
MDDEMLQEVEERLIDGNHLPFPVVEAFLVVPDHTCESG